MSFAENAKKIVTDTADNVVKASGDFVEKSKLKYKIYDAKIDKKRLMEKLGEIAFAEFMGEETDDSNKEKLCIEIREIETYIADMNEKLNK